MKSAVRRLALVATPALVIGLAGCSIHEQTQKWYTPADGVSGEAGDIGLRNVLVVSDGERGTVIATLANRGSEDELTEIVIGDVTVEIEDGGLEIPARGYATLGPNGDQLEFDATDAEPGRVVDVEFRFANAPRATVEALVQAPEGYYADALPEPAATILPVPQPTTNSEQLGGEPTGEATEPAEPTDGPTGN